MKDFVIALKMLLVMSILLGVGYTATVTSISELLFPKKAQGSLITKDGKIIGSQLIAQGFSSPAYFWPRPSAGDYQTIPSAASNYGPTSAALLDIIKKRKAALETLMPQTSLPSEPSFTELFFSSGSGLDPDISPKTALAQIPHIAKARHLNPDQASKLSSLVMQHIESPQFNILGQERVNVLELNLALDQLLGKQ